MAINRLRTTHGRNTQLTWSADVYLNRLNPFTLLFVAHNRLQSYTNPYIFFKATVVISLKKKTILGKGLFNNNFIYFASTLFISKSLLQH